MTLQQTGAANGEGREGEQRTDLAVRQGSGV